jgi:hypothetical protein
VEKIPRERVKCSAKVDKRWCVVERDPEHDFRAVERDEGVEISGVQTFAHEARGAAGKRNRGSALRTQADVREARSLGIGDRRRPRFEADRVTVNAPQDAVRGECLVTMRAACCRDVDERDVVGRPSLCPGGNMATTVVPSMTPVNQINLPAP